MRAALRQAVKEEAAIPASAATVAALGSRGLCYPGGELTDKGRVAALALLPLQAQCKLLALPLVETPCSPGKTPELIAKRKLESEGYEVCFTEGGIVFVTLYCLAFTRLRKLGENKWGGLSYERVLYGKRQTPVQSWMYAGLMSYKELLPDCPNLEDLMVADIAHTSRSEMLASFEVLHSWQVTENWFPHNYVGLTQSLVGGTYDALGPEALAAIAQLLFLDPYAYIKGWPDLAAVRGGEFRLVEVKTTDRLTPSQLITIPGMMKAADLSVVVWRLLDADDRANGSHPAV
jgi:hypothetical protein